MDLWTSGKWGLLRGGEGRKKRKATGGRGRTWQGTEDVILERVLGERVRKWYWQQRGGKRDWWQKEGPAKYFERGK